MKRRIVHGQRVSGIKLQRSRELRRRMTAEERLLWKHLRAHGLAGLHFRRQQVIDGFIVDFYCSAVGLVIEVDGASHDGKDVYDFERDLVLTRHGLRVLRFTNDQVNLKLPAVLRTISAAIGK